MVIVDNINKKYGKHIILSQACIEAKTGELICLVGPNGCGKTTLLKILAGVIKPDSGTVTYYGHDLFLQNKVCSQYIGYVPQDNPLIEDLSVKDNIKFWTSDIPDIDADIVKEYKLDGIMKQKVSSLSGGMKRRLTLACVLMRKPSVLILDEPTSSLDIYYQKLIIDSLVRFTVAGGIVIMSTHNRYEIEKSNFCYVFDDDKINKLSSEDAIDMFDNYC